MGLIPIRDLDFFFVQSMCHVDQFTFQYIALGILFNLLLIHNYCTTSTDACIHVN